MTRRCAAFCAATLWLPGLEGLEPALFNFLAARTQEASPLELPRLLPAFEGTASEEVGRSLLAALQKSENLSSLKPGMIARAFSSFPEGVRRKEDCLFHVPRGGGQGGRIGPDLTHIGAIRSDPDFLEAIAFPSATFARGHEPFSIITRSGLALSSTLGRETPDTFHVTSNASTTTRVLRSEIANLSPAAVSIMPEGLHRQLPRAELSDLIAFLSSLK